MSVREPHEPAVIAMKAYRILLITLAAAGLAVAETPRKAPLTKYSSLWTNSPFTSKPPPPPPPDEVNLLDDYALLGVSPIAEGYRVTLINKKTPEKRITVDSNETVEGFKIMAVTRTAGDPLKTVVRMMSGTMSGTVGFDDKLLTVAPPAVKPAQPQAQPPIPGQPVNPAAAALQRQPRPRVVPPPAPTGQPAQPAGPSPGILTPPNTQGTRPDLRHR